MIILQIPTPEPLYQVLGTSRRKHESIPSLVVRTLVEKFLGQPVPVPAVPSRPLLDWVEVIDE